MQGAKLKCCGMGRLRAAGWRVAVRRGGLTCRLLKNLSIEELSNIEITPRCVKAAMRKLSDAPHLDFWSSLPGEHPPLQVRPGPGP